MQQSLCHKGSPHLPQQVRIESVESMLALNMYSPNAVYACKTYMLVKMGVPAACCSAVTFSALSLTHVHADCVLKCNSTPTDSLDDLESNLAAQLLLLAGQRTRGTQNLVNAQPLRKLTVKSMYSAEKHYA